MTFDWRASNVTRDDGVHIELEAFATCRQCDKSSILLLETKDWEVAESLRKPGNIDKISGNATFAFTFKGVVSVVDRATVPPPAHVPQNISKAFREGAKCIALGCPNAAGAMLRLCLDLASKDFLGKVPDNRNQPSKRQRENLSARLEWLVEEHWLPAELHDLVKCIRDEGNQAAHEGVSEEEDVEATLDLTVQVLERVYTSPAVLAAMQAKWAERKGQKPA